MIENTEAERGLLATAILSEHGRSVLQRMNATDFTDTRHRVIATTINDMIKRDHPVDALTLSAELRNKGKLTAPGGAGGQMYVTDLVIQSTNVVSSHADHYADQVRAATRLRLAFYAGRDLAAATQLEDAGSELDSLLRKHTTAIDSIPGPLTLDNDDANDELRVIMSEHDKATDWVIPGWLAREDRAVLVAGEGIAKTTMLRQFAVCIAAGLNPWNGQRVAPGQRVLFIDAENSRNQSRRAYRWISNRIQRPVMATGWMDRVVHKTRNDGVDLPGRDAGWFMDTAARVCPDVLILGPAYKLMRGDPQKDRDVQDLLDVIDKVRVQQNCAVLVETHAPHGAMGTRNMRPYGSSVWLRWPEIGVGYQRDMDERVVQQPRPEELQAVDWRGQREERDWPTHIRYGDPNRRELPWVPNQDEWAPSIDLGYQIPDDERRAA